MSSPSAPAPRSPAAPPAPMAPPKPAPVEDTITEWYWIDKNGAQHGPGRSKEIKDAWRANAVDGECIAWNPNLEGWAKISTLPDLMATLAA